MRREAGRRSIPIYGCSSCSHLAGSLGPGTSIFSLLGPFSILLFCSRTLPLECCSLTSSTIPQTWFSTMRSLFLVLLTASISAVMSSPRPAEIPEALRAASVNDGSEFVNVGLVSNEANPDSTNFDILEPTTDDLHTNPSALDGSALAGDDVIATSDCSSSSSSAKDNIGKRRVCKVRGSNYNKPKGEYRKPINDEPEPNKVWDPRFDDGPRPEPEPFAVSTKVQGPCPWPLSFVCCDMNNQWFDFPLSFEPIKDCLECMWCFPSLAYVRRRGYRSTRPSHDKPGHICFTYERHSYG